MHGSYLSSLSRPSAQLFEEAKKIEKEKEIKDEAASSGGPKKASAKARK